MYKNQALCQRRRPQPDACMTVPLFAVPEQRRPLWPEPCGDAWPRPPRPRPCRHRTPPVPVRLENPCDPCEQVTVYLSVDECGNLLICVRRDWD